MGILFKDSSIGKLTPFRGKITFIWNAYFISLGTYIITAEILFRMHCTLNYVSEPTVNQVKRNEPQNWIFKKFQNKISIYGSQRIIYIRTSSFSFGYVIPFHSRVFSSFYMCRYVTPKHRKENLCKLKIFENCWGVFNFMVRFRFRHAAN